MGRAGILTSYPSTTVFTIALGPPNPWLIASATETLDFRGLNFSLGLRLLMPTFSLLSAPAALASPPSVLNRMLSYPQRFLLRAKIYTQKKALSRVVGILLSPGTFSAHRATSPEGENRIVGCYTLFKGWLPLSQPSICLWRNTTFYT